MNKYNISDAIKTVLMLKPNIFMSIMEIQEKIIEHNLLENFKIITLDDYKNLTKEQTMFIITCNNLEKEETTIKMVYVDNILYLKYIDNNNKKIDDEKKYYNINKYIYMVSHFSCIYFVKSIIQHDLCDEISPYDYYDDKYNLFHYICNYDCLEGIINMCQKWDIDIDTKDKYERTVFEYDTIKSNRSIYDFLINYKIEQNYKSLNNKLKETNIIFNNNIYEQNLIINDKCIRIEELSDRVNELEHMFKIFEHLVSISFIFVFFILCAIGTDMMKDN
jgi:hypothetical protein